MSASIVLPRTVHTPSFSRRAGRADSSGRIDGGDDFGRGEIRRSLWPGPGSFGELGVSALARVHRQCLVCPAATAEVQPIKRITGPHVASVAVSDAIRGRAAAGFLGLPATYTWLA